MRRLSKWYLFRGSKLTILLLIMQVLERICEIARCGAWEHDAELHVLSMKVLRCWVLPLGMTLSRLFEDLEPCLRMVRAMSCIRVIVTLSCTVSALPDRALTRRPTHPC